MKICRSFTAAVAAFALCCAAGVASAASGVVRERTVAVEGGAVSLVSGGELSLPAFDGRTEHGKAGKIAADTTASDFIARIVALKKLCFTVTGDAETGYVCAEVPATDKAANLTLTFDAKGNVRYSGKIGGKSISGTSVLNIDAGNYCTVGDLAVPLGKTEALYFALVFERGENDEPVSDLQVVYVTDF